MKSTDSIAISGMSTAMLMSAVSAHNVANALSPSYRRQQVVQTAQSDGGVSANVVQLDSPGSDLIADAVQQVVALYSFKANLRTLQVEHEILGSIINLKA